jgi:hypothetical protein
VNRRAPSFIRIQQLSDIGTTPSGNGDQPGRPPAPAVAAQREWSGPCWGKNRDEQNVLCLHGAQPFFDDGVSIVKEEYDVYDYLPQVADRGRPTSPNPARRAETERHRSKVALKLSNPSTNPARGYRTVRRCRHSRGRAGSTRRLT